MKIFFKDLYDKIIESKERSSERIQISGLDFDHILFFINDFLAPKNSTNFKRQILILETNDQAEDFFELLKKSEYPHLYFLPGDDSSPYRGRLAGESHNIQKFKCLSRLTNLPLENEAIVVTSQEGFFSKLPLTTFFKENSLSLETSDIIRPVDLAKKLVDLGYSPATTMEEPGVFSKRGEIFDIYPLNGNPIRINYFDDMIEEIFSIDIETQKTNRNKTYEKISISPAPQALIQDDLISNLRSHIPMPHPGHKNKYEFRKSIFEQFHHNILFDENNSYHGLFFKRQDSLLDFLPNSSIHFISDSQENKFFEDFYDEIVEDFNFVSNDPDSDSILPSPDNLYFKPSELLQNKHYLSFTQINLTPNFDDLDLSCIDLKLPTTKVKLGEKLKNISTRSELIKGIFALIKDEYQHSGDIIFAYQNKHAIEEFKHLLETFEVPSDIISRIFYQKIALRKGFLFDEKKIFVLSEADLFSFKVNRVKKKFRKKTDLFAEQIGTLKEGDYVIHQSFGVGKYLGLETINNGVSESDFLTIEYENKDKVFVPVYKLNLIQKHSEAHSKQKLANLRTNKFSMAKEKAQKSAKKLAFDLLKLQAERKSAKAFAFSPPDQYYKEFELSFPFQETKDQALAIEDVLNDMQKSEPMDRLICGDVGFGKTEVAIRAAFKAVLDKKQVAILVPTTVLCLQHFNSFKKRFKNFPVEIEFLSRFKSAKESKEVLNKLENGQIDIIIGTHKLLSDKIKYFDLGLIIVDEEQRFGVAHKEKFKVLKSSVDFLTLTATPIPRTMQLAFLGLKDLSQIQTAPPKRQSIKSYVIKEDDDTIRNAIIKEIKRGGQVFYVHNRVQDIEQRAAYLKELVPEAKIIIGHGQLTEKELEKRMSLFYSGEYHILLSTTIIESGIDIPTANTMIINRADRFGLSQLHQLRGRIGRSDKKAYAYFIVPKFRNLTPDASRRLKALNTYCDMGSGFSIASSDLEIRGAGDILGGEQSGHIDGIGLELYMELLNEAIAELKHEKTKKLENIEIQTKDPAFIPNYYIEDPSQRLKYYKNISNCQDNRQLGEIRLEMEDIFGVFPQELNNLFLIIEIRNNLNGSGLTKVQVAGKTIILQFNKATVDSNPLLRDKILNTFLSRPKVYQFTPDYNVIFTHKELIEKEYFLQFSKDIAQQIIPC